MSPDCGVSDSFDRWSKALQTVCGPFVSSPLRRHDLFIGEVHRQDFDGLSVAHVRTNAALITRQSPSIDRDDDRFFFLLFQRSGKERICQHHHSLELIPQDLALLDSARAFEIAPRGLIENVSIHLPRERVERQLKARTVFTKLANNSASTQLIRALVHSLINTPGSPGGAPRSGDSEALQCALLALLPMALTEQSQAFDLEGHVAPNDLYGLALALIDEQLQDSLLSPAAVARRLHFSLRSLYRLFEERGESVSRYIQHRRLIKIAEELSVPSKKHESITQIAFKWGFSDAAHFSRAFKREFEQTPRDYRAHQADSDCANAFKASAASLHQ
ncbi:transcriptional regulator FeaR [Pseudomonas fluorescens]|uniref:transcriptional regulator FeaR n=1 Tax=Pseudomonas fluorescens TaxID=294 RepID=UPI002ACAB83D|nr:transcriptional regulator FeaR [Pseudomonas fluorescens]MDZ5431380.1 transcriptional regulator FeaR [Pseudomonas fluorescens]